MKPTSISPGGDSSVLVQVSQEAGGQFLVKVPGLLEIQAQAATVEDALAEVRTLLAQRLSSGQLVSLTLPSLPPRCKPAGWAKDDPLEQEFLDDLARLRRDDLERTLREYEREDQGCSDTSSTPIT